MQDSATDNLGEDPLERLKNLLVLLVEKLLLSYQVVVAIVGIIFLLVIFFLVIFFQILGY